VRKNHCVDAASTAAWVAATVSAIGAVIAARQARYARGSAEGALRQAESTHRQALAAEEDLLLRKLEIQAGGDRTRALRMLTGRALATEYLVTAKDFLDLLVQSTRWGFPNNTAESGLQYRWTLLVIHLAKYKEVAEEQGVTQAVDSISNGIAAMSLGGWLVSPFKIEEINTKRIHASAQIALVDLDGLLSDPFRFDRRGNLPLHPQEE
jgi:hypothetical protein